MSTEPEVRVVSVSLGSKKGDHRVEVVLGGRKAVIERRGTDGDLKAAAALFAELDGQVDALGLGGTDLWLYAGDRRYLVRDAARLVAGAKTTPVADGSGLKHTLERQCIRRLNDSGQVPIAGKRVLIPCAVDRFGLAETIAALTDQVVFGDLMFGLGIPIPIRSIRGLHRLARLILPIACRLPFRVLYPTGSKQRAIVSKWEKYYRWADIIAGDFHFIRRHLPAPGDPPPLAGKTVITNTTTAEDVDLLRERGLACLVTTTPRFGDRSFGTNVIEALLTAFEGGSKPLPPELLLDRLDALGLGPSVIPLGPAAAPGETPPS